MSCKWDSRNYKLKYVLHCFGGGGGLDIFDMLNDIIACTCVTDEGLDIFDIIA